MNRKSSQIVIRVTKDFKTDIVKQAKKDKKYIGEILEEGYELYKKKHWLSVNFEK